MTQTSWAEKPWQKDINMTQPFESTIHKSIKMFLAISEVKNIIRHQKKFCRCLIIH
jgi:hypothetical protein